MGATTLWLPEVALTPDQAPDAAQLVAPVEDQVIVEEAPVLTLRGLSLMGSVAAWALTAHARATTGSAAMRNAVNKLLFQGAEIGFVTGFFLKLIGAKLG